MSKKAVTSWALAEAEFLKTDIETQFLDLADRLNEFPVTCLKCHEALDDSFNEESFSVDDQLQIALHHDFYGW